MESHSKISEFLQTTLMSSNFSVYPLAGDASARRYFRVVHESHSFVLMTWEPFVPEKYPFLNVQAHFKKAGVQVPESIAISGEYGMILLEDLGDLTLERRFWERQTSDHFMPFYEMAIDELIKIHFEASRIHSPCIAFDVAFDQAKLLWELKYAEEHFLNGLCKANLSTRTREELKDIFELISKTLADEPRVICHRDYHSRNLMIKLNQIRVIDFQDARMGPIQYDLVSLLRDSYVQLTDDQEKSLLSYYFNGRKQPDHFERIYEIQTIQRCFKACGSFASFWNIRQDQRYLKYLHPTLKRVLKSLSEFSEFKLFFEILIDSGGLERKFDLL